MTRDRSPQIRPLGDAEGLILKGSAAALRELAAGGHGGVLYCAHTGSSMNPTLHESDLLEILPADGSLPAPGDVLLFVPPGGDEAVVHRVVRVTAGGIRTRGDNNSLDDAWSLRAGDLLGTVAAAWRGERRRVIAGGRAGRFYAGTLRLRRRLDRGVSALLHPLYDALARSGIVRRLAPARLRPRVVVYEAGGERRLRLMVGRRAVGRYDTRAGRWRIRRPWRLLVDEGALPAASGRMEDSRSREQRSQTS